MGVKIVAGRAGSGKSLHCFERIVGEMKRAPLGPAIYWVVPRQETFTTERWLTCGSGLAAFSRCRVVSFETLAEEVIEKTGGGRRAMLSKAGRATVLGHLLRTEGEKLKFFRSSARTSGLALELMGTLDELARHGACEEIEALAGRVTGSGDGARVLREKLGNLAVLQRAYRAFLAGSDPSGEGRFDKDTRMAFVLERVGRVEGFKGAMFYVDGFTDLLDFERRMIGRLAEVAAEVEVSFCMPPESPLLDARRFHELPEETSLFRRTEMAHRSLRVVLADLGVRVDVERKGDTTVRFGGSGLARVEAVMGGDPEVRGTAAVRFLEAADVQGEVEAAAREIMALTREGYRLREIVVFVREMGAYGKRVAAAFRAAGIQCFMDERRDASGHPLVRLVRSVLSLAVSGWNTADVAEVCKGGLVEACGEEAAFRLETWAVGKGIVGEAWVWAHPTLAEADGEADILRRHVVGAVGPVVEALRREGGVSVRDACTRLLTMMEALGVRKRLSAWCAAATARGEHELRAEHEQVWREVMGFLEELAELLGETSVTGEDLQGIVLAGLGAVELKMAPPTVDQVLVGPAERLRVGDAKVAIVMGLSSGIFPRNQAEEGLLSDAERRALRASGIEIDDDGNQRQLDERLIGYLAMTRASERLILTRPTADATGAALPASLFWNQLRETVGVGVAVERAPGSEELAGITTGEDLTRGLLRWARSGGGEIDGAWRRLYAFFRTSPRVERCRGAAWPALSYRNEAKVRAETAARLFPMPLRVSDRELEAYAACPYKHFAEYTLGLKDVAAPAVDGGRVSGLLHGVLERVCRGIVKAQTNWDGLPADEVERELLSLVRGTVDREVAKLTWDGSADVEKLSVRDRYVLSRVAGLAAKVVEAHRRAAGKTRFEPLRAGVRFGETDVEGRESDAPAVVVPLTGNGRVIIEGRIDRVDVTPEGNKIVAWDYALAEATSGGGPTNLTRMYHGLALKVLVHLMVLRDSAAEIAGEAASATGVFVLGLTGKVERFEKLEEWREAPEVSSDEFQLARRKARGLFDRAHLEDLDPEMASPGAASQLFHVRKTNAGELYGSSREAMSAQDIAQLLDRAEATIAALAEGLAGGVIAVSPYKLGSTSACARCGYLKVCRFDVTTGSRYRVFENLGAAGVVKTLAEASDGGREVE